MKLRLDSSLPAVGLGSLSLLLLFHEETANLWISGLMYSD